MKSRLKILSGTILVLILGSLIVFLLGKAAGKSAMLGLIDQNDNAKLIRIDIEDYPSDTIVSCRNSNTLSYIQMAMENATTYDSESSPLSSNMGRSFGVKFYFSDGSSYVPDAAMSVDTSTWNLSIESWDGWPTHVITYPKPNDQVFEISSQIRELKH